MAVLVLSSEVDVTISRVPKVGRGNKIVEVETLDDYKRAFNEKTIMTNWMLLPGEVRLSAIRFVLSSSRVRHMRSTQ